MNTNEYNGYQEEQEKKKGCRRRALERYIFLIGTSAKLVWGFPN